jgi:hypothetical protein
MVSLGIESSRESRRDRSFLTEISGRKASLISVVIQVKSFESDGGCLQKGFEIIETDIVGKRLFLIECEPEVPM